LRKKKQYFGLNPELRKKPGSLTRVVFIFRSYSSDYLRCCHYYYLLRTQSYPRNRKEQKKFAEERKTKMAVLCSSSTVILSSSSVKSSGSERKSPFLGFSLTAISKPSVRVGIYANSKRGLQVKCEAEPTTTTSLVPANQRWMFDEEEANGPVTIIFLSPSVFSIYAFIKCRTLALALNLKYGLFFSSPNCDLLSSGFCL